jgi:hypothetical protein
MSGTSNRATTCKPDRTGSRLRVLDVQPLTVGHAAVEATAARFGFVRG